MITIYSPYRSGNHVWRTFSGSPSIRLRMSDVRCSCPSKHYRRSKHILEYLSRPAHWNRNLLVDKRIISQCLGHADEVIKMFIILVFNY